MNTEIHTANRPSGLPLLITYAAMALVAVGAFFIIRWAGENWTEATEVGQLPTRHSGSSITHVLPHLLAGLVTVIALARLLGAVLKYFGQPSVMGEVIAGIVLGPSILGRVSPEAVTFLFPTATLPILSAIAQIGVILYMFLVGLHLNVATVRTRAHATVMISHASIALPFLLGAALAIAFFDSYAPEGIAFTSFALFMGLAMAITAFPVLARILTDRGMERSELGIVALSCAAADDVTAWCLLALVIGITQNDMWSAATTIGLSLVYVVVMLVVVNRILLGWVRRFEARPVSNNAIAVVLVLALVSSVLTDLIGIHALFGAFLLGALIPHDSEVARVMRERISDLVTILLMPAFFAYTGTRTEIGLLSQPSDWGICLAIVVTATVGKLGGAYAAARFTGLDRSTSAALGLLMNTRGLMELIVLNIGLDLGILSPSLFAMMVIMALVTTLATTPLLNVLDANQKMIDRKLAASS